MRRILPGLFFFLYMAALFAGVHARSGGAIHREAYFHARFAAGLPERGLSRDFPWTTAGRWSNGFVDRDFLYHVLLSPFTRGADPIRGAAVFSSLLSAAVFAAFFWFLLGARVRAPEIPAVFLALMGAPFLMRISMTGPFVFAALILVLSLTPMLARDWRRLAGLGVLSSWAHAGGCAVLLTALAVELGRWTAKDGFDRRVPLGAAAGLLLGLVLHPYSPGLLGELYSDLRVLGTAFDAGHVTAVRAAQDYYVHTPREMFHVYPLVTALVVAVGMAFAVGERRLGPEAAGLTAAAFFALFITFGTQAYIEYAGVLTAAAAALMWRDFFPALTLPPLRTGLLAAATMLLGQLFLLRPAYAQLARIPPPRFAGAAAWMSANLEPGEIVVNLWWSDFPELYYHAGRQRFVSGMDPSYMLRGRKELTARLERTRLRVLPLDPDWLAEAFGARFLVLRAGYVRLYPELWEGPWRPVFADAGAAIYSLAGTGTPAARPR